MRGAAGGSRSRSPTGPPSAAAAKATSARSLTTSDTSASWHRRSTALVNCRLARSSRPSWLRSCIRAAPPATMTSTRRGNAGSSDEDGGGTRWHTDRGRGTASKAPATKEALTLPVRGRRHSARRRRLQLLALLGGALRVLNQAAQFIDAELSSAAVGRSVALHERRQLDHAGRYVAEGDRFTLSRVSLDRRELEPRPRRRHAGDTTTSRGGFKKSAPRADVPARRPERSHRHGRIMSLFDNPLVTHR